MSTNVDIIAKNLISLLNLIASQINSKTIFAINKNILII